MLIELLPLNDTEFDGFMKEPFSVEGPPPFGSTLVCKICKDLLPCTAPYDARIFYINGGDSSQRACIHLSQHRHPIKVDDYKCIRKKIDLFIEEHFERTPKAPFTKIVIKGSKQARTFLVSTFFAMRMTRLKFSL